MRVPARYPSHRRVVFRGRTEFVRVSRGCAAARGRGVRSLHQPPARPDRSDPAGGCMSLFSTEARQLRRETASAVRAASPWVQGLARLGYAAKGIVYAIIGGLAARAALSPGRDPE